MVRIPKMKACPATEDFHYYLLFRSSIHSTCLASVFKIAM